MKTVLERAVEVCDGKEEWLLEQHVSVAIRHGGEAILRPDVVLVWVPGDPVEGDNEHTAMILFCAGDVMKLARYAEEAVERGFTHVAWCRGFKRGYQGWQKHKLDRWAKAVQAMNGGKKNEGRRQGRR